MSRKPHNQQATRKNQTHNHIQKNNLQKFSKSQRPNAIRQMTQRIRLPARRLQTRRRVTGLLNRIEWANFLFSSKEGARLSIHAAVYTERITGVPE